MASKHATTEIRKLVIYQTEQLGWNTRQVAEALGLTSRTVQRVKKRHHDEGVVTRADHKAHGRPKVMSSAQINVCSRPVLCDPTEFCVVDAYDHRAKARYLP
jgi:transposase